MINRKNVVVVVVLALATLAYVSSCKKDTKSEPLEPISLVKPDSAIIRIFAGDSLPMEIKFTTDRPINWIMGKYDIDSLIDSTTYQPTYPDTLFFMKLDTLDPRVNLYTYTGSYHVPDTLAAFSIVRFRISFQAGKTTFTTGQNYPAGLTSASKDFKINVR